jgi:hypothetical protein
MSFSDLRENVYVDQTYTLIDFAIHWWLMRERTAEGREREKDNNVVILIKLVTMMKLWWHMTYKQYVILIFANIKYLRKLHELA